MTNFRDPFEGTLIPLVEALKDPASVEFDDDLALLVCNIIRIRKEVTDTELMVIGMLPRIQEKYKNNLERSFMALNALMTYGRETLVEKAP
jgi:hypothetical protein